jgi:hypothetical protein
MVIYSGTSKGSIPKQFHLGVKKLRITSESRDGISQSRHKLKKKKIGPTKIIFYLL